MCISDRHTTGMECAKSGGKNFVIFDIIKNKEKKLLLAEHLNIPATEVCFTIRSPEALIVLQFTTSTYLIAINVTFFIFHKFLIN